MKSQLGQAVDAVRQALQREKPVSPEQKMEVAHAAIVELELPDATARAVLNRAREQGVYEEVYEEA